MLKLIKKEGTRGGMLGYDEIQILGARPWALAKPGDRFGPWCKQEVRCLYLVVIDGETDPRLTSFTGEDIAVSLGDYHCFLPGADTPITMDMDGMWLFFS